MKQLQLKILAMVSDRGASIRIPIGTVEKGWKGWLEDRRPASNADPYKIASRIIKTVKSADILWLNYFDIILNTIYR